MGSGGPVCPEDNGVWKKVEEMAWDVGRSYDCCPEQFFLHLAGDRHDQKSSKKNDLT